MILRNSTQTRNKNLSFKALFEKKRELVFKKKFEVSILITIQSKTEAQQFFFKFFILLFQINLQKLASFVGC